RAPVSGPPATFPWDGGAVYPHPGRDYAGGEGSPAARQAPPRGARGGPRRADAEPRDAGAASPRRAAGAGTSRARGARGGIAARAPAEAPTRYWVLAMLSLTGKSVRQI